MSRKPAATVIRVLVVEDSVDEAFLLRSILEARGHRVRTVQDGQSALDLWDGAPFDVVVTDLNLPGMDGVELTAALTGPGRDAVVIAVTGYSEQRNVESARRAGARDVLPKPIDPAVLVERVESAAAHARQKAAERTAVLVVAARAGDATFGCGGTLVRHRSAGHQVTVLFPHGATFASETEACVRAAAWELGVQVRLGEAGSRPADDAGGQIERAVEEIAPHLAYVPSVSDDDGLRRAANASSLPFLQGVPEILGYLTPTSSLDFRPDILKVVTPQMSTKLDAILALDELGSPALTARFVQATARWWGRSTGFTEVEPFEHVTV